LSGGHPFLSRQGASMLYERRESDIPPAALLSNPIRYSDTLRSYFPQNVWGPLKERRDTASVEILASLAGRPDWIPDAELQSLCAVPATAFWQAVAWLTHVGLVDTRTSDRTGESYRIRVGMFTQWFQQSEVTLPKHG